MSLFSRLRAVVSGDDYLDGEYDDELDYDSGDEGEPAPTSRSLGSSSLGSSSISSLGSSSIGSGSVGSLSYPSSRPPPSPSPSPSLLQTTGALAESAWAATSASSAAPEGRGGGAADGSGGESGAEIVSLLMRETLLHDHFELQGRKKV